MSKNIEAPKWKKLYSSHCTQSIFFNHFYVCWGRGRVSRVGHRLLARTRTNTHTHLHTCTHIHTYIYKAGCTCQLTSQTATRAVARSASLSGRRERIRRGRGEEWRQLAASWRRCWVPKNKIYVTVSQPNALTTDDGMFCCHFGINIFAIFSLSLSLSRVDRMFNIAIVDSRWHVARCTLRSVAFIASLYRYVGFKSIRTFWYYAKWKQWSLVWWFFNWLKLALIIINIDR